MVTVDAETQWSPEVGESVSLRRPPRPPPPPRDLTSISSAKDDGPIIPIAAPVLNMRWCIAGGGRRTRNCTQLRGLIVGARRGARPVGDDGD
jgi:hypothetical protein